VHYFGFGYSASSYLTDEQKLEIAKRKAAEDLAKELLKHAVFTINQQGDVEGIIDIP
jgi:hypothetical protein